MVVVGGDERTFAFEGFIVRRLPAEQAQGVCERADLLRLALGAGAPVGIASKRAVVRAMLNTQPLSGWRAPPAPNRRRWLASSMRAHGLV